MKQNVVGTCITCPKETEKYKTDVGTGLVFAKIKIRSWKLELGNDYSRGITLISLVITIVILIILAGVTINLALGENGLFSKAKQAKQEYANAQTTEEEQLNELYAYLTRDDLPENTKENPQDAGTIVKLPSNWATTTMRYVSTSDGQEVTNVTKVSTVYAVSVGNGETVPVPNGFYYVGGNLNTGVIISDNSDDRYGYNPVTKKENDTSLDKTTHAYRKNLQGNQFVWIPCSIDNYNFVTTYAKNTNANYGYDRIPGEIAQIEKYGGFYVGRYEAGICMPTGTNNSGITTANILDGTSASSWQCSEFTTTTGKPVVQAGAIPWYHAHHSTASNVAENMYKGNSYVTSGLMTGTMWDQMIAKIGDGNTTTSGNYSNSTYTSEEGIYHTTAGSGGTGAWSTKSASKGSGTYWLVESGMLDTYARYHIYDTAGNLWEWVEQVASDSTANIGFTLRGGSFTDASSVPASCRYYYSASRTDAGLGFRVALYIK